MTNRLKQIFNLPARIVVWLVRAYQLGISPMLGRNCRFQPTCSSYMIQAIEKYGLFRGTLKGIIRICKCHPFHPGGYDPP